MIQELEVPDDDVKVPVFRLMDDDFRVPWTERGLPWGLWLLLWLTLRW
jgi:hypothetical protein